MFEARRAWSEGHAPLYAPAFSFWEMLPGYLYLVIDWGLDFLSPHHDPLVIVRAAPAILGLIEILLFGLLSKKLIEQIRNQDVGPSEMLAPMALYSLCPWHLLYSRIYGTCTGAGAWQMLLMLIVAGGSVLPHRRSSLKALCLVSGLSLLWYTTLRIPVVFFLLQSLLKGLKRQAWAIAASIPLTLTLVFLSGSPLARFFLRGTYNLETPDRDLVANYWGALTAAFLGIDERFSRFDDGFFADWIHKAFLRILSGRPLLSTSLACVCAFALILIAIEAFRRKALPRLLVTALGLAACLIAILGAMGPSTSRLLLLLPLLGFVAVYLLERIGGMTRTLVSFTLLLGMAFEAGSVWTRLGDSAALEDIFSRRVVEIARRIPEEIPPDESKATVWISAERFLQVLELEGRSGAFSAISPGDPIEIETMMRRRARGGVQHVIFDLLPREDQALDLTKTDPRLRDFEKHLRYHAEVLSERSIPSVDGRGPLAHLLRIRWIHPFCFENCHP